MPAKAAPPAPSYQGSYNGQEARTSGANGMTGHYQWTGGSQIGGRGGHWKLLNAGGSPGKDYKKN